MTETKPCRKELLDWINVLSFAVDDAKLFLDTHPCDQEALEYFDEFKKQRVQALKEYAKYYAESIFNSTSSRFHSIFRYRLE